MARNQPNYQALQDMARSIPEEQVDGIQPNVDGEMGKQMENCKNPNLMVCVMYNEIIF